MAKPQDILFECRGNKNGSWESVSLHWFLTNAPGKDESDLAGAEELHTLAPISIQWMPEDPFS
jgi:hypothetical protein